MEQLKNKQEAAEYLGVSIRTLQRLMTAGRISYQMRRGQKGDVAVFDTAELDRYKRENEERSFVSPLTVEKSKDSVTHNTLSSGQITDFSLPKESYELYAFRSAGRLLLTIPQASEFSSLTVHHLRQAIRSERLEAAKIGRSYLIRPDVLMRYTFEVYKQGLTKALPQPSHSLSEDQG